jgi:peptidoglycan/xylan/chitin deacetylase (PgdA/CDA1 family)
MDHPYYEWSPLAGREPLRWPSGAPLALAVVVLVEHAEVAPPPGTVQIGLPGGVIGSAFPPPNLPFFAHREYGHRIGIFRILDALAAAGVPPTVAVDAMAAERYPYVVQACAAAGAEFVAHGISISRIVTGGLSEADERAYLGESRDRVAAATGAAIAGWLGPEQSESERTPALLDELGFGYVCDWPNDEQPYRMSTPRRLVSVPTSYMLDDGFLLWSRPFAPDVYPELVGRAAATLAREGTASARSLVLVLRPWLSGQPHRIAALEAALSAVRGSGDVWATTTGGLAAAVAGRAP